MTEQAEALPQEPAHHVRTKRTRMARKGVIIWLVGVVLAAFVPWEHSRPWFWLVAGVLFVGGFLGSVERRGRTKEMGLVQSILTSIVLAVLLAAMVLGVMYGLNRIWEIWAGWIVGWWHHLHHSGAS